MKNNGQYILIIIMLVAFSALMNSCYSSRVSGDASSPDYNKRVNVSNAYTVKRSNAFNVVFDIGLIGAGGYAGYQYMPLVQKQTSTGKEPVKAANAAIGALAGAGLGYLFDVIAGKNKTNYNVNPNEWIRKANPQYKFLNGDRRSFTMIHSSAEKNYVVKNIQDVKDFKKIFPNSSYAENVVRQSLELSRNDMVQLLALYPNSIYANDAKVKYITESPTFSEALAAAKKYPVNNAQSLLVNKIRSIPNAILFIKDYPSYPDKKQIVINGFKSPLDPDSMEELKNNFGSNIYLTANDLNNQSDNIRRNYYNGMYLLKHPANINEFNYFVSEYSWLKYNDKNVDFLSKYWDLIAPLYSKGIDVLTNFARVETNPKYSFLNIRQSDLIQVINDRMAREVTNNVRIVSTDYFGAQNEEFEKWKRETGGPIALKLEGEVNFIVCGEIQNNSKFDLPVEISAGGMLQLKRTTKAANWLDMEKKGFSIAGLFAGIAAMSQPNEIKNVEHKENEYYLPKLPAKTKTAYAVMLYFGRYEQGGAVIYGIIQQHVELLLSQVDVKVSYFTNDISIDQIKKQDIWQNYAKNKKLPSDAKLYDYSLDLMRQQMGMSGHEIGGVDYELSKEFHESVKKTTNKISNYIADIISNPAYDTDYSIDDPNKVAIPAISKISSWYKENFLDGDSFWSKDVVWTDGTKGEIRIYNDNYATDNLKYYKSELDALNAEYVYKKYGKIRTTGEGSHSGRATPDGIR
jgi:uncharacterized protein YlzI (FlbEa/FlbD family)